MGHAGVSRVSPNDVPCSKTQWLNYLNTPSTDQDTNEERDLFQLSGTYRRITVSSRIQFTPVVG